MKFCHYLCSRLELEALRLRTFRLEETGKSYWHLPRGGLWLIWHLLYPHENGKKRV